ncbi:MAG: D-alanine--D-alanine ligase [Deltaproteobacteria bacterium]|nr:D-alanine--D-alanine ligase [Deltaproteobacteria bacterium]
MANGLGSLRDAGYEVMEIDIGSDPVGELLKTPIDVAFVALHGRFGEDGTIQGLLESLRIPYTGSGVLASAVAMDKSVCKQLAHELEIPVANGQLYYATTEPIGHFVERLALGCPLVVKPVREGSTVGMTIVRKEEELPGALQLAASSDPKIVVEEFVAGTEVTVGMVAGRLLPTIEIVPKGGFYDYTAKYTKGMTEYICPARIAPATDQLLGEWTSRLWQTLECRGFARADYIVRPDGSAVFLELNTIPGMTATSLIPKAAAQAGIGFGSLCELILEDARVEISA